MILPSDYRAVFFGPFRQRQADEFIADLPPDAHTGVRAITAPRQNRDGEVRMVPALEVKLFRAVRGRFELASIERREHSVCFLSPE